MTGRRALVALLLCVLTAACSGGDDPPAAAPSSTPSASYANPTAGAALALQEPGMHEADVTTAEYTGAGGARLGYDLYRPADAPADQRLPVVVLVHGDTSAASPKSFGGFVGWGQLLAASGFAALVPDHRPDRSFADAAVALEDVRAAMAVLRDLPGVDPARVGVLGFSAGGPIALRAAYEDPPVGVLQVAVWYGPVEQRPYGRDEPRWSASGLLSTSSPPLHVVTAARDEFLRIGEAAALLRTEAPARGLPVTFDEHAEGSHGFDVRTPGPRTQELLRDTVRRFEQSL